MVSVVLSEVKYSQHIGIGVIFGFPAGSQKSADLSEL